MITVNMNKAKDIGHTLRRYKRDELFAPHDAVIMKQIPSADNAAAEEARVAIRAKDAEVQSAIESASNADQIKAALLDYDAIPE